MPGVRSDDRPRCRVPHGDDRGGGLVGFQAAQHPVQPGEDPVGGRILVGERPHRVAELSHQCGRSEPVPGHIADDQAQPSLDGERVVPVTTHRGFTGRKVRRGQPEAAGLGQDPRQERLLQQVRLGALLGGRLAPLTLVQHGAVQGLGGHLGDEVQGHPNPIAPRQAPLGVCSGNEAVALSDAASVSASRLGYRWPIVSTEGSSTGRPDRIASHRGVLSSTWNSAHRAAMLRLRTEPCTTRTRLVSAAIIAMFAKDAPVAEAPSSASATATSSGDTAADSAVASRQMSSSSTSVSIRVSSEIGPLPPARGESAAPSPSLPQGDSDPAPPGSVAN